METLDFGTSNIFGNTFVIWSIIIAAFILLFIVIPMWLRKVVPTNEVHIVQSKKETVSYGKGMEAGNVYYAWPSWIPKIGVVTSTFPLSIFAIDLSNYDAYDSGRLPFMVDIMAFFRIANPAQAAERVNTFTELETQLRSVLQGAVRSILAKNELENILSERGTFGTQFTAEVGPQLSQWGCETVKNIEFMDIRDSKGSAVIQNIMDKKKSLIEMESRVAVAENHKTANIAEIAAEQASSVRKQESDQVIGIRTAEKDKEVGIAKEKSNQEIQEQAKITAEKQMAVASVKLVKQATMDKEAQIIAAEQAKQTVILGAEATLESTKRAAEGQLITATNSAKGIELEGLAEALATKSMQLASVEAQTTLAEKIGANIQYQDYLIRVRTVEKEERVGIEQAGALKTAQIKVIANSGDIGSGVNSIGGLFSSKGGLNAGAMLESFANTDAGAAFLARFGITLDQAKAMLNTGTAKTETV